jgi:methionyl-tRNA formyltransferase
MIDEREGQNRAKRNQSYGERGLGQSQPSRTVTQPESYRHKTSIVFFGSGPVAAASLQGLLQHFAVEAVITKAQATHHKAAAPVETIAEKHTVPIYYANSRRELDSLFAALSFESPVAVLIDYGVLVSENALQKFKLGIINSHFSLLPEWRGADPITFALLSGQAKTGVSLMKTVRALDEGPLLSQEELEIPATTTNPELSARLVSLSNAMLARDLPLYIDGTLQPYPQPATPSPSYSRKLTKQDGVLDWHKSAEQLEREIRAFYGWPKSRTTLAGYDVIICEATVVDQAGPPGTYKVSKDSLVVYAATKALRIIRLQPAGKKEMPVTAFLAGYKI